MNVSRCLALGVLVLAACAERPENWAGRVLEVEGVRHVENPSVPLARPGEVSQELRWSRSGPEGGDIWEAPNKLHVFGSSVYLVDRRASKIHVVTTAGELRPSIGESGAGPGQYRRIIDAIPTPAGLFVVDGGNGRIEVLRDLGERIASYSLGQVAFAAAPLGEHAIAVFGVLGAGPGWTKIDADGNRQPLEFPDFEAPEGKDSPISSASTWGDRLVRLRCTSPQVRIYSTTGVLERVIDIPLPMEEASDEEIEGIVREVSAVLARDEWPSSVIQQQVAQIRARPREKARFRRIVFDDVAGLAAIWEQNPEELGSGNASLHLLSVDGVYLAALAFDHQWADFTLADGVLYVLERDPDTDLVSLMAYDLAVAPGLLARARQ